MLETRGAHARVRAKVARKQRRIVHVLLGLSLRDSRDLKNNKPVEIKNVPLTVRANHRSRPGWKKIASLAHQSMKTSATIHENKTLPKNTSLLISLF